MNPATSSSLPSRCRSSHCRLRCFAPRRGCLHDRPPLLRLPFTSFLPHQAFSPVASSGSLLYLWNETGPPPVSLPSSSSSTSSPAASTAHPPKALAVCNPLAGTYRLLTSPWTALPRTLLPPPPSPSPRRPRPLPARRHGDSRRRAREIQSAVAQDAARDGRRDGWAWSGHGGARQRADGTCSRRRSPPKSQEDEPRNLLLPALTMPFLALLPALRLLLLRHPRPEGGGCLHAFDPDRHCSLRLPFTSFLPHQAFSPVASSGSLLYLWNETGPPPVSLPSSSSSTSSPPA
ncbi:hypothetical protein ZWY2020_010276 [Hordeum vulgare]|nr:hypothetical protein ZWY2020_010276 [Hordeum vulgare]